MMNGSINFNPKLLKPELEAEFLPEWEKGVPSLEGRYARSIATLCGISLNLAGKRVVLVLYSWINSAWKLNGVLAGGVSSLLGQTLGIVYDKTAYFDLSTINQSMVAALKIALETDVPLEIAILIVGGAACQNVH
jgi:hypothetical protein